VSSHSLLELLHPGGTVRRVLVLGQAPVAGLVPRRGVHATKEVDLVLIVPSGADLRRHEWLGGAARAAQGALAEDGIVYALLPRGRRRPGTEELRRAGLLLEAPVVQLGKPAPRYLVPVTTGPWRYAFGSLITSRPLLRRLIVAVRRMPLSARVLTGLAPAAGVVGRRAGSPPLAAWVSQLEGDPPETAGAVAAASWRGEAGSAVLHCFRAAGLTPTGLVKVTTEGSTEPEMLARLAPTAQRAGARAPRLLAKGMLGDAAVVAETIVAGTPAASILARSPRRLGRVVASVATWLERWNVESAARDGGVRRLDEELVVAMDALADALPDADAYRCRLKAACSSLEDRHIPVVARHNDLTMWNVLLEPHAAIGVIDWGEAEEAGLPLTDLFYAVADAMAASTGYRSRLEAVQRCFPATGNGSGTGLQRRMMSALGVTPEAAELCFHACWLRHARNELATPTGDRSFLEIARWLARGRAALHA
jgi:hypothetical protein